MKDREIQCEHYVHEGECNLRNKECHFRKEMQTCGFYKAKRGGKPARKDLRQEKLEKISKDRRNWE